MFGQLQGRPATFVVGTGWDPDALSHWNRVLNDGGQFDEGYTLSDLNYEVKRVKSIFGGILSRGYGAVAHPSVTGYNIDAGSGPTENRGAAKVYSLLGVESDFYQTTASAQPLILRYNGDKYAFCGSTGGNSFLTPAKPAVTSIVNDFEIMMEAELPFLPSGGVLVISNGSGGSNSTVSFGMNSTGGGFLQMYQGAVAFNYSSTAVIGNYNRRFWKVTRNATTGEILFYTSSDGVTYNQLGGPVIGITGAVDSPTGTIAIGQGSAGVNLYSGYIKDGIGGSNALYFDCLNYDVSVSQHQWNDSVLGDQYTVQRNVGGGYKALVVYQTILQGDAIDDQMNTSGTLSSLVGSNVFSTHTYLDPFNLTTGSFREISGSGNYYIAHNTTENFLRAVTTAFQRTSPATLAANRLCLGSYVSDGANSKCGINNSYNIGTLNTVDPIGNTFKLFGPGDFNGIITTFILTKASDGVEVETALYNLIRSWNGNPA